MVAQIFATTRTPDPSYPTPTTPTAGSTTSRHQRSTEMYTMYEALAREHLNELHRDARSRALYREVASSRRRHRAKPRSWRRS